MLTTPNSSAIDTTLPSSPVAKPRLTIPPLKRPLPKLISSYGARGLPRSVPPTFQPNVTDDWDSLSSDSDSSDIVPCGTILDELLSSEVEASGFAVVSPLKYLTSPCSRFSEHGVPFDWECYELAKMAATLQGVAIDATDTLVEEAQHDPNKFYYRMMSLPKRRSDNFHEIWPQIKSLEGSPRPITFWASIWRYFTVDFLPRYFSLRQACILLEVDPVVISKDRSFAVFNFRQLTKLKRCFWYATPSVARELAATRLFKPISSSAILSMLNSLRSEAESRGELCPSFSHISCPFNHKADVGWDLIFVGKGKLSQHLASHYEFVATGDAQDDEVKCNECRQLFATFASFTAHAPNCSLMNLQPSPTVISPTERIKLAQALLSQYLSEGGQVAYIVQKELRKLQNNPHDSNVSQEIMVEQFQDMMATNSPGWLSRTTYQLWLMPTSIEFEVWAEVARSLPPQVVVQYLTHQQRRINRGETPLTW